MDEKLPDDQPWFTEFNASSSDSSYDEKEHHEVVTLEIGNQGDEDNSEIAPNLTPMGDQPATTIPQGGSLQLLPQETNNSSLNLLWQTLL